MFLESVLLGHRIDCRAIILKEGLFPLTQLLLFRMCPERLQYINEVKAGGPGVTRTHFALNVGEILLLVWIHIQISKSGKLLPCYSTGGFCLPSNHLRALALPLTNSTKEVTVCVFLGF